MNGKRVRWERRLMAVLAVVGLVAAGAAYDRSDDAAGRAGLALIGLSLSGNDVAHFERIYDRLSGDNREPRFYREHNRWRRAQLRYDGTVYTVRVKSHGRDPDGHSVERDGHRFISLSIKMASGDRVAGLNRFKLIVGENLTETQQLVMTAAREAHVLLQDHRLVRVQINDWPEQLFHFSNLLDDEYTEAAGQASLRIVTYDYPDDSVADKALVYTDSPHYRDNTFDFPEHFRRAMAQLETPPDDWEPLLRRYSDFNTAIRGDSAADPAEFFDLEYLGRYEAIRYVLGLDGHGFILNNLRVFLNTANGKFYPALGRDDIPSTLDLSGSRTPELATEQLRLPTVGTLRTSSRCFTSSPAATACGRRSIGRSTASSTKMVCGWSTSLTRNWWRAARLRRPISRSYGLPRAPGPGRMRPARGRV